MNSFDKKYFLNHQDPCNGHAANGEYHREYYNHSYYLMKIKINILI